MRKILSITTPQLRASLSRQRGVTLIELIMVLAISSFMIALAINGLSNSGRAHFDDGMRQVLNNLREVQGEAADGQAPLTNPPLAHNNELFGKAITFSSTTNPTQYKEYFLQRPDQSQGWLHGLVQPLTPPSTATWPGNVRLKTIQQNSVASNTGLLVFARGASGSDGSEQVSSQALPFFFPTDAFRTTDPAPERIAATYDSSQGATVTLSFESLDSKYKSRIVIDQISGTMELKQW